MNTPVIQDSMLMLFILVGLALAMYGYKCGEDRCKWMIWVGLILAAMSIVYYFTPKELLHGGAGKTAAAEEACKKHFGKIVLFHRKSCPYCVELKKSGEWDNAGKQLRSVGFCNIEEVETDNPEAMKKYAASAPDGVPAVRWYYDDAKFVDMEAKEPRTTEAFIKFVRDRMKEHISPAGASTENYEKVFPDSSAKTVGKYATLNDM